MNGTSFLVEMKPANYRVTMTIGDAQEATQAGATVEQMNKLPVASIPAGEFKEVVYDIALIDGIFDFSFSGSTPKINALKIERLPEQGAADQPTLYLASDSTVANYAESYRPQAGWGETLGGYFDPSKIVIDNRAVGGLSSKTFLTGGYLNDILLGIHEGDYLFMQWSHNDSTPSRPERYLTPEQFKMYLKDYINGAVQRGAVPVLVTPVNRRDFSGEVLNKSFPAYVQAMKETAQETGTALVDLNQASWEYFQELGPEGTKSIFMWTGSTEDNTHLQMNGAIKVSELVAGLVKQLNLPLSAWVTLGIPLADGAPGLPELSDNNGHDTGLRDGDYTITMNMWWGNNGTRFKLFENSELIEEGALTDQSPSAQSVQIDITGRPNGTYVYTLELSNGHGAVTSAPLTVTVTDASPGQAVLSNDNWDGDGSYAVTMNLWWGTNAAEYQLYENGVLVDTQTLEVHTPDAQSAVTVISGKTPGTYEYEAVLLNAAGESRSVKMTVTVGGERLIES